jgi:hypothetical protein
VLLKRAYNILLKELLDLSKEEKLQITIKAINDIISPNNIIFTLFIFWSVFPYIIIEYINRINYSLNKDYKKCDNNSPRILYSPLNYKRFTNKK